MVPPPLTPLRGGSVYKRPRGGPARLAGCQRHKTPLHERTNRQRAHIDGEASCRYATQPTSRSGHPAGGRERFVSWIQSFARLAGGYASLRPQPPVRVPEACQHRERHGVSLPRGDRSLRDRRVSGCPGRRLGRLTPCRSWGVSGGRDGFPRERCPREPLLPPPATRSAAGSTRSTSPVPHASRWPRSSHSPAPARDPRGAAYSGG